MRGTMRTLVVLLPLPILGLHLSYVPVQDIGDRCRLTDGSLGFCEHVAKCKSAQNDLRKRRRPLICSFVGIFPIVCCADAQYNHPYGWNGGNAQVISKTSKSEEKCSEYLQLDIRTTITTTTTPAPGPNIVYPAAVGGEDANDEEFPHMAILGYGSTGSIEFQCGGSLISDQFVLTAGHCLESRQFGPVSLVRLGELDIASDTEKAEPQDFQVAEIYSHPNYDFVSAYNDIALIKLDRPVTYTRYVKPACLQSGFELEHNNLTATGWGALEYGGSSHSILQKVHLKSLPMQSCLSTYRPQPRLARGIDEQLQICGGNLEKRMDTCEGDSGGPLQLQIQDSPLTHRVVGVTSVGSNCGLVPGIYTRVSRYISWIESIVWPN